MTNALTGYQPEWVTIIGTQRYCVGTGTIYTSPNVTGPWNYTGNLYSQFAEDPQVCVTLESVQCICNNQAVECSLCLGGLGLPAGVFV